MGLLAAIATVVAGTLGAGLFVTIATASSTTEPSVILGGSAVTLVGIGGLLTTATSVNAVVMAVLELPYSWSCDEIFPGWFSDINKRFSTPYWSLFTLYVCASLLMLWGRGPSHRDRGLVLPLRLRRSRPVTVVHRPGIGDRWLMEQRFALYRDVILLAADGYPQPTLRLLALNPRDPG